MAFSNVDVEGVGELSKPLVDLSPGATNSSQAHFQTSTRSTKQSSERIIAFPVVAVMLKTFSTAAKASI